MSLDKFRSTLLERRQELEGRLERTHRHIFQKTEPVSANFHEQVTETGNDQLVMTLEEDAKEEIAQINNALQRITDGEYLICKACGEAIGLQRLEAIPYTDRCVNCADQVAVPK